MRKEKMCLLFLSTLQSELNQEDRATEMRTLSLDKSAVAAPNVGLYQPSFMADVFFRVLMCLFTSFLAEISNYVWGDREEFLYSVVWK